VFQIIFNEISAAEISQLDTLSQLDLLAEFTVSPGDLEEPRGERFGHLIKNGKTFYRYRAKDLRIYFEVADGNIVVHRVLHKNTFADFLFRTNLGDASEDEILAQNKHFWKLIEEGQNARKIER